MHIYWKQKLNQKIFLNYYCVKYFHSFCLAIENELKQQRKSLAKQREEYYIKSRTLRKELELLHDQKKELLAEKLPENEKILKENQKLQVHVGK